MSENNPQIKEADQKISRRQLFSHGWRAIKAGAAGVALPHFVAHEGQKTMEDYFTIDGIEYHPYYEDHFCGVAGKPAILDVVFWELATENPNSIYEADPIDVDIGLLNKTLAQQIISGEKFSIEKEPLWIKIVRECGRIAFGDVYSKNLYDIIIKDVTSPDAETKENVRFIIGLSGILIKAILPPNKAPDKTKSFSKSQPPRLTRRSFLADIALLLGTTTVLNSFTLQQYLMVLDERYRNDGKSWEKAIIDVLERLSGLASNFRPDNLLLLYRNLVMADKIFLLGDYYSKIKKTQSPALREHAKIGFKFGKAHQGIEDLLYLGRPVIHELLFAFYEQFLRKEIAQYGLDFLPKVRVLKYEEITLPNNSQSRQLVDETTLIDIELSEKLRQRFSQEWKERRDSDLKKGS